MVGLANIKFLLGIGIERNVNVGTIYLTHRTYARMLETHGMTDARPTKRLLRLLRSSIKRKNKMVSRGHDLVLVSNGSSSMSVQMHKVGHGAHRDDSDKDHVQARSESNGKNQAHNEVS